jgi:hypothetical protein
MIPILAKTEQELKTDFEVSAGRENLSAWAVVLALLFEAVLLWRYSSSKSPAETALFILADLVIAGGVYGEIRFGRRASAAGAELQHISDAKVAAASLETERLRARFAWRSLSSETVQNLASELKSKPGSIWVEYMSGDPESRQYAGQFVMAFRIAGWKVGLRGGNGHDLWFGIIIPKPEGPSAEATAFIDEAFTRAGFGFNIAPLPQWASSVISMPPPPEPAARIFIGPRQSDIQDVK